MELLTILINKSLFVIFFMSCLVVIRQLFLFYRHLGNPEPQKYTISTPSLIYLGLSVSIIITALITGVGL